MAPGAILSGGTPKMKSETQPTKPEKTLAPALRVKTSLFAGYWSCTGVKGEMNRKGVIHDPTARYCTK
jgi:hypothetical protein